MIDLRHIPQTKNEKKTLPIGNTSHLIFIQIK